MNEALQKEIVFGFEELKLNSIEAFTNRNNEKSIQLLERNNFKLLPNRADEDDSANIIFELNCVCVSD